MNICIQKLDGLPYYEIAKCSQSMRLLNDNHKLPLA